MSRSNRFAAPALALSALVLTAATAFAQAAPNRSLIAPLADAERAGGPVADAFDTARPAVVHVLVEVYGRNTFKLERPSSGVVVDATGLVLTWWDLVEEGFAPDADDKKVFVQFPDGERHAVEIAEKDDETGLVLLRIEAEGGFFPSISIRPDRARTGENVGVLGYYDGEEHVGFSGVATPAFGAVRFHQSPDSPAVAADDLLLTDAAIEERNHGSVLLDAAGGLLGLCSAQHVRSEVPNPTLEQLKAPNYGVVVPSDVILRKFAEALTRSPRAEAPVSEGADACARVAPTVVAVRRGEPDEIGAIDPFADRRRVGVGSGVIIDASGVVLTSRHLVEGPGSTDLHVVLTDGRTFPASIDRSNSGANLAILQLDTSGADLPAIAIGNSEELLPGDRVFALGNPEGDRVGVSAGVLSARRGNRIQVDATIGNRNSGGPLVDARGALVGLCDAGVTDLIDRVYAQRGDRAKLDSGLYYTPALSGIRPLFGDAIPERNDTQLADATASGFGDVVDRIAPSMLNIYIERVIESAADEDNPFAEVTKQSFPVSLGSGVIIDASGLALTNWHVVDAATFPDGSPRDDHVVTATRFDGRKFDVTVLAISREEDLSLIRLRLDDGEVVQPVELGDSGALRVGDRAFAIGNPEGNANTITAGIVTALEQGTRVKGRWAKLEHLIETDAAINGGNSGGALLDGAGRLIGINSAGGSGFSVTGYAISVDHVRERVKTLLLSDRKLRSLHLGARVEDLDDGSVQIAEVRSGSPAQRAGLAVGDLVRKIDGAPVRWSIDYKTAGIGRSLGPLPVTVERDGTMKTIDVEPIDRDVRTVETQIGAEVTTVRYADEEKTVLDASIAVYRAITGDADGAPRQIPRQLVRVARISPPDTQVFADEEERLHVPDGNSLRVGDLILGAQYSRVVEGGTETEVFQFTSIEQMRKTFQRVGDYSGRLIETWIWRNGEVDKINLVVARQLW